MPVRIVICGLPRLLSDAVSAILAADGSMAVIARLDDGAEIATAVEALRPDALILEQIAASSPVRRTALRESCPGIRIIAIGSVDGLAESKLGNGTFPLRALSATRLIRLVRGRTP